MCFYSKYGEKEDVKKMAATAAAKRSSEIDISHYNK